MAAPFVQPNDPLGQEDTSTASQPLRATVDNPFIPEERDGGSGGNNHEPPAIIDYPAPTATTNPGLGPPAYSEAVRRSSE